MISRVSPSLFSDESIRRRAQFWKAPAFFGLVCLLVYNANLRQIGAGDTLPARYLPLNLWHNGTLELDAVGHWVAHGHPLRPPKREPTSAEGGPVRFFEPWSYWIIRTKDRHLAPLYPVVTPLVVAPLYLPAVLYLNAHHWEQPQIDRVAEIMEKLSASLLASLASVLMYILLRRECGRWTLPLALAFAFGSNTWMISSQALWQHGVGEFLIALALLLAISTATPLRSLLLGAVCAGIAANRPPDALLAAAIALSSSWSHPRRIKWLTAGAALPAICLLYYNLAVIGHIAGGYGIARDPSNQFFRIGWSGFAGLLISPTRGLLVFTPFLLFAPLGFIQRLRASHTRSLVVALGLAMSAQLLLYSQADWRAGTSWGPRWLTDLLPVLVWMLAPALLVSPFLRRSLWVTIAASIAVQTIGAFWYTKTSDDLIFAGDHRSMRGAWNFRNTPFLVELWHPPAPGELHRTISGSLDLVGERLTHAPGEIAPLYPGVVLEGWALAGGRTPAQLIALVDGTVIGSTENFLPRTDVNNAMRTRAFSGWHLVADTRGVGPGEHLLQLAMRREPRSDINILREQRVLVQADKPRPALATPEANPLDALALRAASLLAERQNADGYWLTSYTDKPRFESARPEMNTFLTAMMFDILSPIVPRHDLGKIVESARAHLGEQIEQDGLVRYHGRPDGATIGTLGCVITPDSDDTALAWRIAGHMSDPRKQGMLEELARYRDGRGLYRTWLAPRAQYQCLDPGRDPNPADVVIQMHIYLMLREFDPVAAEGLCHSLNSAMGDEDIWVYYAHAPLIPYLRGAELRQRDCSLSLPSERLAVTVAGQEPWVEGARLLVEISNSPATPSLRDRAGDLLMRLGREDFAELRRSPPLLYHNDLSATVSRYYWSEDFGYALWLRLFDAVQPEASKHL